MLLLRGRDLESKISVYGGPDNVLILVFKDPLLPLRIRLNEERTSPSMYIFALDCKVLDRLRDITGPVSASAITGFLRSAAFPRADEECVLQNKLEDGLPLRTKSVGSAFSINFCCEVA